MPADNSTADEDDAPRRRFALEDFLGDADDEDDDMPAEEEADPMAEGGFEPASTRMDQPDDTPSADTAPSDFDDIVTDLAGDEAEVTDARTTDDAADEPDEIVRPDIDTTDPEVADAAFDFAGLETLPPSETPASDDTDSMFGDLVDRLSGGTDESAELDRRSVGRVARLEAEGILAPSTNALMLAGAGSVAETETCASIMTALPAAETNVLLVWLSRRSTGRFDHLLDGWEYRPHRLGVISRAEALDGTDASMAWEEDALVRHTIRDPADLTQIGITISQVLADWEEHPGQTVVCFDSVSELLRHSDPDRVFRFLHILDGRLDGVDATAHFHLDGRNHELATIRTLQSLFDATIEVDDDGITRVD